MEAEPERGTVLSRSYESALKELLEETALRLEEAGGSLEGLVLPQNVLGVAPPTVDQWLNMRAKRRE